MARWGRGRGGGGWGGSYWPEYVPVAEKRARAAREAKRLAKAGRALAPVVIEGRKIARTFWGEAWCDNLERYRDFAYRLERGRSYARNGSVLDLQVAAGKVEAQVSGSSLYEVTVQIKPLAPAAWKAIVRACSGQIASVVELLAGRLSAGVMEVVSKQGTGLFPTPREITLKCSCPDYASMCKHVAASLYGVGARLDHAPELLFTLRGVDPLDLVDTVDAGAALGAAGASSATAAAALAPGDLAAVFGIELDAGGSPPTGAREAARAGARAEPPPKRRGRASAGGRRGAAEPPSPPAEARPVAAPAAAAAPLRGGRGSRRAPTPAAELPEKKLPAAAPPAKERLAATPPEAKLPAKERPATESPAAKPSAKKQPSGKQPAAKQPAAKQPAAKQPAAKRPAARQPDRRAGGARRVETISAQELVGRGVPRPTIQGWLRQGVLGATDARGRYRVTPEARARLEGYGAR